jgi:hypothetical protein
MNRYKRKTVPWSDPEPHFSIINPYLLKLFFE